MKEITVTETSWDFLFHLQPQTHFTKRFVNETQEQQSCLQPRTVHYQLKYLKKSGQILSMYRNLSLSSQNLCAVLQESQQHQVD